MQPLARYRLDAAIVFSDILTIPDAMGLGLYFAEGEGPKFERPLREEWEIRDLSAPDPSTHLRYVLDAVRQCRQALAGSVPLIGFSGSPFTLACYMIEGKGSSDFASVKKMLYLRPDLLHKILSVNTVAVTDYLNAQIEAGAEIVMIFDTWGGMLPDGWYQNMSLASMQKVISLLPREHEGKKIPVIMFTKGGAIWLNDMAQVGADVIALDWTMSLSRARKQLLELNKPLALQGNLDPLILFSESAEITRQASNILDDLASAPALKSGLHPLDGHVFNLGHGISQFTPPESVAVLAETVITRSRALRSKQ